MQRDRLSEETATCIVCNQVRSLEDFYLRANGSYYKKCKDCYREYIRRYRKENKEAYRKTQRKWYWANKHRADVRHRERVYGLAKGEYLLRFEDQDGRCGICREPFTGSGHIDHDHSTGEFRGLLCRGCNTGLGFFREDVSILENAIRYLECWQMRQSDLGGNELSESGRNDLIPLGE